MSATSDNYITVLREARSHLHGVAAAFAQVVKSATVNSVSISVTEWEVLHLIGTGENQPSQIATLRDTDKASVSRRVKSLENAGLVSSVRSDKDERVKILTITTLGTKVLKDINDAFDSLTVDCIAEAA